jgi:hypothetical protein
MNDFEEWAQKTADHIVDVQHKSHFVKNHTVKQWIKTALLTAYSRGRTAVYEEEQVALCREVNQE